MRRWAILGTGTAALALAAACGSSSSGGGETAEDGGGNSSSSGSSGVSGGSGSSSGSTPLPLEAGVVDFACQSVSDCPGPELCCGSIGDMSAASACAAGPCPTGATAGGHGQQLCATSNECPAGDSCLALSGFAGVGVCVYDDAGTTGTPESDGAAPIVDSGETEHEAGETSHEAGPVDSGSVVPDAEGPVDTGSPSEASTIDAGHPVDAATPEEASTHVDASAPVDAATTVDAASTDAGPHDAAAGG